MGQPRAEVGAQPPALHAQPELGQAAVAKVGALGVLGPAGQLAVEEDGDAEAADLRRKLDRLGTGRLALVGVEPDQRADVERADCRVQAVVGGHVDRLERLLGPGEQGVAQRRSSCRRG